MANRTVTPEELLDIPQHETSWPVQMVAGIVFLNGIFAILGVVFTRFSVRLELILPIDYVYYGRIFGLFAGFLLIYFSSRLLKRKQLAWWIAFVGSLAIVIDHALFARNAYALLLPATSLVLLAVYYREFRVKSEPNSVKQGVGLLILSITVALAYGTLGFTKLLPRDFIPHQHFTLYQGMVRTVREYTLVGNSDLIPRTREARWFLDSLDALGVFSIAFAFLSLFRPLTYRYGVLPQERERARKLLDEYGTSSEDAFKLWPEDKSYYFLADGQSFVAYRVARGVAVVLGEPVGPKTEWHRLMLEFKRYCHVYDWTVALLYIPHEHLESFERAGFKPLKIGEDAIVDTAGFVDKASRNKHFRAVRNKFDRTGYRFDVSEAPQVREVLSEASAVTRSWLTTAGRKERSFGLGYHETDYLRRSTIYSLYDSRGKMVAFANAIRSYDPNQATIDLMRHVRQSETGTMDMLMLSIIEQLATDGVKEFSLGLAPLGGVGENPERTVEERVIGYFGRAGIGRFSYEGLRKFKDKFEPDWQARYLVYERGPVGLAVASVAVAELLSLW